MTVVIAPPHWHGWHLDTSRAEVWFYPGRRLSLLSLRDTGDVLALATRHAAFPTTNPASSRGFLLMLDDIYDLRSMTRAGRTQLVFDHAARARLSRLTRTWSMTTAGTLR